jgi:hypothetical protein
MVLKYALIPRGTACFYPSLKTSMGDTMLFGEQENARKKWDLVILNGIITRLPALHPVR